MRLMMLDPDTFDIRGYVDSRQVMKDLSFTPGKLLHFMARSETYKGCILVEDDEKEDEKEERFNEVLFHQVRGSRWYVTRSGSFYRIFKNGKRSDLVVYKHRSHFEVNVGSRDANAVKVYAEAFLGWNPNKDKRIPVLYGDVFKPARIEFMHRSEISSRNASTNRNTRRKKVALYENGHKVRQYYSARAAGRNLGYSGQSVCDICNGKIRRPQHDLRWVGARKHEQVCKDR